MLEKNVEETLYEFLKAILSHPLQPLIKDTKQSVSMCIYVYDDLAYIQPINSREIQNQDVNVQL